MAPPQTNVQLRQRNLRALLRAVRDGGPLAKRELQERAQVSWCTVSVLTGELEAQGLVVPTSKSGLVGRKAFDYDITPVDYFTIGVDLNVAGIRVVVTDLTGRVAASRMSVLTQRDADSVLALVYALLDEQMAAFAGKRLLGIGVAAQGLVDAARGVSRLLPLVEGWRDVPLCALLTQHTGLPCVLLHDPDCILLAERQWGDTRLGECRYGALLRLDTAVGVSLLVNGQVYAGGHGQSGDLGHIPVNTDGPRCPCGRRGCLHEYVSRGGVVRRYVERRRQAGDPPKRSYDESAYPVLVERALRGDPLCVSLFEDMGKQLGIGLNILHNLFDLEQVVLCGEMLQLRHIFDEPMRAQLCEGRYTPAGPLVTYSRLGADAAARGAAFWAAEQWIDRDDFGIQ